MAGMGAEPGDLLSQHGSVVRGGVYNIHVFCWSIRTMVSIPQRTINNRKKYSLIFQKIQHTTVVALSKKSKHTSKHEFNSQHVSRVPKYRHI